MLSRFFAKQWRRAALFLAALFVHQLTVAPLAWAECAHHFGAVALESPAHNDTAPPDSGAADSRRHWLKSALSGIPQCGEQRVRQAESARGEVAAAPRVQKQESAPHGNQHQAEHCLCGDLSCSMADAVSLTAALDSSRSPLSLNLTSIVAEAVHLPSLLSQLPYAHGPPILS